MRIMLLAVCLTLTACTTYRSASGARFATSGDVKGLEVSGQSMKAESITHSNLWNQVNKTANALGLGFLAL